MFDKKKKGSDKEDLKKADMEEMHPGMKSAKMGVLKHLSDMASEAMSGKLDGLKKVTVASDSEEGLKHGIDKAKEIVEKGHIPGSSEEVDGSEAHELPELAKGDESPEAEASEYEDMPAEEIEKKIAELKALLEAKKA